VAEAAAEAAAVEREAEAKAAAKAAQAKMESEAAELRGRFMNLRDKVAAKFGASRAKVLDMLCNCYATVFC
jgi:hypothetical protein